MEVKRIVRGVFQSKSEIDDGDFLKNSLYQIMCEKSTFGRLESWNTRKVLQKYWSFFSFDPL